MEEKVNDLTQTLAKMNKDVDADRDHVNLVLVEEKKRLLDLEELLNIAVRNITIDSCIILQGQLNKYTEAYMQQENSIFGIILLNSSRHGKDASGQ